MMLLRSFVFCVFIMGVAISMLTTERRFYLCRNVPYFLDEERCVDGILVPRTTSTTSTTTASTATSTTPPSRTRHDIPRTHVNKSRRTRKPNCITQGTVTNCGAKQLCDAYKCCGNDQVYNPDISTCCTERFKSTIFDGKERDHVCCNGRASPRGHHPCLSPDANDRLWDNLPQPYESLCQTEYVYIIKSIKSTATDERRIVLQQILPTRETFTKPFAMDKYTPVDKLPKGQIVVLTNVPRMPESKFYLYDDDAVFGLPKRWSKIKPFRAQLKICQRRLRNKDVNS